MQDHQIQTAQLRTLRVGSRYYGLELNPLYVGLVVRRLQALNRRDGILQGSGQTLDEIASERTSAQPRCSR